MNLKEIYEDVPIYKLQKLNNKIEKFFLQVIEGEGYYRITNESRYTHSVMEVAYKIYRYGIVNNNRMIINNDDFQYHTRNIININVFKNSLDLEKCMNSVLFYSLDTIILLIYVLEQHYL